MHSPMLHPLPVLQDEFKRQVTHRVKKSQRNSFQIQAGFYTEEKMKQPPLNFTPSFGRTRG